MTNGNTARCRYDVIVVGAGGSGLAAAASAAENGADVLVLEKQAEPGGSTALAVGSFTTSETNHQRRAGISDSASDHAEDAGKFAPPDIERRNNAQLRSFLVSNSRQTLEWLCGMGLAFHGPSPEPPNRVARMHNVVPGARAYILALQSRLHKFGGEIRCNSPVTKLVQNGGRVTGVIAEIEGRRVQLDASAGVVLAAGDYANAPDLIARHKGADFANIEGICKFANGDGHRLSEQVGAGLVNMDVTYGPELRFVAPEKKSFLRRLPAGGAVRALMGISMPLVPKFVMNAIIKRELVTWQHPEDAMFRAGAVMVNTRGERFCNETQSPQRETAIAVQPDKIGYILLDERLIEMFSAWPYFISTAPEIAYAYVEDYLRLRPDVAVAGASPEKMACKRGLPAAELAKTISAYNSYVCGEAADRWGRTGDSSPLSGNRWVLLGPAKAYFTTTEGSPAINERMQVLDAEEKPIDGLYAVGQNGLGGQVLWGHGLHIAWAITSGRLVGKALAARAHGLDSESQLGA